MRKGNGLIYPGWFILAASALTEVIAIGFTSYGAGLFVLPLQAELHISRAAANSSLIILYVGSALAFPLVGRMLDRYSIRLVVSLGAVSLASAFVILAHTSSLWLMGAALFLPGAIGFSALGPLKTQALAARWFVRNRGLALGLAAGLAGAGGIFVAPLLSLVIQRYGWRQSLLYEALFLGVLVIVLAVCVLRDGPAALGLESHPENSTTRAAAAERPDSTMSWMEVFSSSAFWIPSLTLATITGASQAEVITFVPYGVQLGFTAASAAAFVSVFALASGVTKVTAGLLADRLDQRQLLVVAAVSMAMSWIGLNLSVSYAAVMAASCLAGVALGCALPTAAGLIAGSFGPARFGRVMGWSYALNLILAIAGVLFMGLVYDRFASYRVAFTTFTCLMLVLVIATALFARRGGAILQGVPAS